MFCTVNGEARDHVLHKLLVTTQAYWQELELLLPFLAFAFKNTLILLALLRDFDENKN